MELVHALIMVAEAQDITLILILAHANHVQQGVKIVRFQQINDLNVGTSLIQKD